MNDALRVGKKAFTIAIAAATILWTVGIAALVVPTAQAVDSGDLIKGETLSTVYYYSEDGTRYIFTTEKGYFSWYEDFSGVTTITDEELADIPLGGNIVYRPGSRWIKVQSNAKTYAVTPDGAIRWIETEDVAVDLAGDDWNQFIDDVPDVYFADYTEGTSIMDGSAAYEGALVSGSTYLIWGGEKRLVTDDGFTANGFQTRFLLDGAGIDLDAMTAGDDVTAFEGRLSDTSQVSEAVAGEEVVEAGDLAVSLASDTPASVTIPEGAAAVGFLKFDVSGTGTIDGLVFDFGGVGSTSNLSNVYLFEGNTRLTDGRSINASTRQVTFSNLGIDVAGTRTLTVRADVVAPSDVTPGDAANFGLASADAIVTDASITGAFPMTGNTMTFSETDAGIVTITKNGNPANPSIGQDGATIGKINIAAASENASIEHIAFTVKKASDHSNYEFYQGSDLLATGTVNNDLVSFDLTADPFEIEEGSSRNFELRADVAGDAGDTIKVTIPNDTDLMAVGSDFGFNMAVVNTAYDSTTANCTLTTSECSYMDIQGGQLTIAFDGPDTGDIAQGGRDVTLMEFTLTAEEYMTIKDFDIILGADDDDSGEVEFTTETPADGETDGLRYSSTVNNLSDISIRYVDSGNVLMGPLEYDASATETASETIEFSDDFSMEAGESIELKVTADVYSSAVSETYAVRIDVSGVEAEDVNGDAISDIVPSSDMTGNNLTVQTPTITVTKTTPPGNGTYVKGASDVNFVGWSFAASAASDIEVTDLTVYVMSDTDVDDGLLYDDLITTPADHISSCSLYDGLTGGLIDGPESFDITSDYATFSSFSWTVEAGESGQMLVTCDLSNVALDTGSANDDAHFIYINASTDIIAVDEDGDSPTITASAANRNINDATPITTEVTYQTVTTADTVTIVAASDRPLAGIILGNSTDVLVNKFKASVAGYEAASVTKITLENDTDDDNAADTTTASSSVKISYVDSNGDTQTKTGYLSAGTVTFSNIDWYVPVSGSSYMSVYIDVNEVGVSGTSSGTEIDLDVDTTGGSSLYSYVGKSSGTTTTAVTGTAEGNGMFVYKSKPTLSLASGSPSGAGIPGLAEVFRFNVSADSRGDIGVDEFTFAMTSTDNNNSDWHFCDDDGSTPGIADSDLSFYDLDAPSVALDIDTDWTFIDSADLTDACDEDTDVIDWIVLELSTADTVEAGDTITYSLYMDTTGASALYDDSIRIDLPADTTVSAYAATGSSDPDGTMIWDDTDGYSGNLNIDGTYLSLPVIGGTTVY